MGATNAVQIPVDLTPRGVIYKIQLISIPGGIWIVGGTDSIAGNGHKTFIIGPNDNIEAGPDISSGLTDLGDTGTHIVILHYWSISTLKSYNACNFESRPSNCKIGTKAQFFYKKDAFLGAFST
jgi:hypothetical protein